MFLHKHLTANSVKLNDFPFNRELAMEAYLIENEPVLALDSKEFLDITILESELSLHYGRKSKKTDGRIDLLVGYGQEYLAIVELKLGELQRKHVEQLEDYLKEKEQILKKFSDVWDFEITPEPKWMGIMVGTLIDPLLATKIRNGMTVSQSIPIAALTLRRYRGEDGQVYVVTDTYLSKKVSGKDYTKYLFNGTVYTKNRLVLAIVRSYVESNPEISYAELKKIFPDELQGRGNYGVFNSLNDAEKILADSGYKRHFIQPDEVIKLKDETIAVCNQWGVRNIDKFRNKVKDLSFKIELSS